MRARPVPEQCRNARQLVARDLESNDGVLECRRLRVTGDRVDLFLMRRECCIKGRSKVAIIESIETRQAVEAIPFDECRVEFWCGRHSEILFGRQLNRQYRDPHPQLVLPIGGTSPGRT